MVRRSALSHSMVAWLRRMGGPRPWVLVVAVLFIAGLFGAFTYEFVRSQADSRHQAEHSFQVQAHITSELTSSLFQSTATAAAGRLGGGEVG